MRWILVALTLMVVLPNHASADTAEDLARDDFELAAFRGAEHGVRVALRRDPAINKFSAHSLMKRVGLWAAVWLQVRFDDGRASSNWCAFIKLPKNYPRKSDGLFGGGDGKPTIPTNGGVRCDARPFDEQLESLMNAAGMPKGAR